MSEWQPIETAPKDGTEILTCAEGWNPCVRCWHNYNGHFKWGPHPETFYSEESYHGWYQNMVYDPDYWMPLPKPPTPSPSAREE